MSFFILGEITLYFFENVGLFSCHWHIFWAKRCSSPRLFNPLRRCQVW